MKLYSLFLMSGLIMLSQLVMGQKNKSKCDLEIEKVYTQTVMGRNIGYGVEIKNNSDKTIDGIEWTAFFYTRFGDLKGKREGTWTSGNIIKPKKPGETLIDIDSNFISGATDVFISIKRVHYTDGSICK
jgi:hypothetical protein